MSPAGTVHAELADEPLPVLQLTNWPVRQRPLVAATALLLMAGASVFVAWVSVKPWLGIVSALCFGVATWRMWIPVRYELDVRGVQQIILQRRCFIPWSAIGSYEIELDGIMLMGHAFSRPWSILRGLFIDSGDSHQELVRLVEQYAGNLQQDETVTIELTKMDAISENETPP